MAPANQTKERSVHELFTGAFRNKSSMRIVLVFLRKKHQNSQKWAKFMNFSFWPFLWFGLPGATPEGESGLLGTPRFYLLRKTSKQLLKHNVDVTLLLMNPKQLLECKCKFSDLSGPLLLRVQSRSRTRLRIAASIAFLFRTCSKGILDTIALLSRG